MVVPPSNRCEAVEADVGSSPRCATAGGHVAPRPVGLKPSAKVARPHGVAANVIVPPRRVASTDLPRDVLVGELREAALALAQHLPHHLADHARKASGQAVDFLLELAEPGFDAFEARLD